MAFFAGLLYFPHSRVSDDIRAVAGQPLVALDGGQNRGHQTCFSTLERDTLCHRRRKGQELRGRGGAFSHLDRNTFNFLKCLRARRKPLYSESCYTEYCEKVMRIIMAERREKGNVPHPQTLATSFKK